MAKETGTATDYKDLLSKLQTFANLHGWTTKRYDTGADDELILMGDGDSTDEIFVGIKTYEDSGAGYYNWECRGFTGYVSDNPFMYQAGSSPPTYVPLRNVSIDYWFWVTGRRICMIAKTGSAYQFMYLGFINQYAAKEEYPYPLLVMGSSDIKTILYTNNSVYNSASTIPTGGSNSNSYIRLITGEWYSIINANRGNMSRSAKVWPNTQYWTFGGTNIEGQQQTPSNIWRLTENNGSLSAVPLLPTIIYSTYTPHQIYGEIHNLYWCTFPSSVTAEDTVTDGVSLDEHVIFHNIHSTATWMGLAIKDE